MATQLQLFNEVEYDMFALATVLSAIRQGVTMAEALLPVASAVGGPTLEKAINLVAAVTEFADHTNALVTEGQVVANSNDEAEIKQLIIRLQRVNDTLASEVDAS
jgi:hypothetical protein